MRIARILPGVAVLNGRVYVVGGEQESLIMANGEIYNPQVSYDNTVPYLTASACFFRCRLVGLLQTLENCRGTWRRRSR